MRATDASEFITWYLVQQDGKLVTPPREEMPPPASFGDGNSISGDHVFLDDRHWENHRRARWNGRFCQHERPPDAPYVCDRCREEIRETYWGVDPS